MALANGERLGSYEIVALLSAGGQGEVYHARDSQLSRDVALKVLRDDRLTPRHRARFQREAQALAALNHPNIATLHGIEEWCGGHALVMELVDGESLATRLERHGGHGLAVEEALRIAGEIALALEAAHEAGIVHRDLKPGNVMVRRDGTVKVLDFGLARSLDQHPGATPVTVTAIETGVSVVGTAAYMSPEQARGAEVDRRTDVWAFGCLLYEMLTGRRAFDGATASDAIASVLTREPDFEALPPQMAPSVRRLLRRCLQKDPRSRLRHIGDARLEIDDALASPGAAGTADGGARAARPQRLIVSVIGLLMALLGGAIGGIVGWTASGTAPRVQTPVARFEIPIPPSQLLPGSLAISPDGAHVAYSAGRRGATTLYLRALADEGTVSVATFEGGSQPFFSPDSQWLGFFAGGRLNKVPVRGGAPVMLANAPSNRGATWGVNGRIVLAPIGRSGLFQVPANGGTTEILTTPNVTRRETSHIDPHWLPGEHAVVYAARGETEAESSLVTYSVERRVDRVLMRGGRSPHYVRTGHLVYLNGSTLMAVAFDADRLEVGGPPVPVVQDVESYGVSDAGSLIYARHAPAVEAGAALVWVTRRGKAEPLLAPLRDYMHPRLSHDGRRIAVDVRSGSDSNIWMYDIVRNALTRLTFEGRNLWPVWSQDDRRVIYGSNRAGTSWDVYSKAADGTTSEKAVLIEPLMQIPHTLSRDGRLLGITIVRPDATDVAVLSPGAGKALAEVPHADAPSLSPDGQWLAYASNESGRHEVYVRPTSGSEGKWQISTDGGVEPLWAASGHELFYRNAGQVLAVAIAARSTFEHGTPHVLFRDDVYRLDGIDSRNYDVSADGQRFVMIKDDTQPPTTHVNVVLNWTEELKRLVPTR